MPYVDPEAKKAHDRQYRAANRERLVSASKAYYAANRERYSANAKGYRVANLEKVRATQRLYTARNKEKILAYRRIKNYPAPTRKIPSVCEVCGNPPGKHALSLDHCHLTKKFRGWLCSNCNRALGHAQDCPKILRALADYLERAYQ